MSHRVAFLILLVAPSARAGDDAAFEKTIRPILTEHCLKCHGADKPKGGLRLDGREGALAGGESGPALVPGDAAKSLLVKAVKHDELKMPPKGKLDEKQIAALAKWVQDGAAWPETKASAKTAARPPGRITPEDRAWWAFQPAKAVAPPLSTPWVRTPVDAFLAAKHAAAGVSPAAEAEKLALLRRVTFDLTGLPPTPAEQDAFANDASPNAYENLVDRLLAGPRYGERQARFWLDLVRYAETDGYRIDDNRPHAWRYRDYAIASFNADAGYDRFVREQLAGDELDPANPDARVATGYLRLWPYEYNQRDVRGQWSAILNDITDVTGDVFLGLGFGCARCHDHKFDPILQKDYFALQAFFAGLHFPDEAVHASGAAKADYEAKLAAWEAETLDVRGKIDELLKPIREKEMKNAARKFPVDISPIFAKSPAERTPLEQQLFALSYRQVDYEYERAASKLSAKGKEQYEPLKKQFDALAKGKPADPSAMVARDIGPVAAETFVPGGRKKAESVQPAFPTVLGLPAPVATPGPATTGRRSALAAWLTRGDNPLTARVMVNRLWQQHFGRGLVATPSDFGTLGEKPTHPELLDWLTAQFVAGGWKLKPIHRLMVTSAAYRQASGGATTQDPENRLLARMPIRRLDAEQVRDGFFAASGELILDAGGPALPADKPRRSIYTRMSRNAPDALLASFDAADGSTSCACRNVTVTPTQSLLLLNGKTALARAQAFAKRVMPTDGGDAPAGIATAFRLAFGRAPTATEAAEARAFLKQQVEFAGAKPEARLLAWADFCHALLNANEFLYLD